VDYEYIRSFILYGQERIKEIIDIDEGPSEEEDFSMNLIL